MLFSYSNEVHMQQRSRFLLFYIFVLIFSIEQSQSSISNKQFQILSTSANSITLKFQSGSWQYDSIDIDGISTQRFRFENSGFTGEAGSPMLPYSTTLIGIPVDATARLSIISIKSRELENITLTPYPTIIKQDDISSENYEFNSGIYKSNKELNPEIVTITETGFFRNQQVVQVQITPLQVEPGKQKIRLIDELTLKVAFSGSKIPTEKLNTTQNNAKDEDLYTQSILNYEQARNWRKPQTRRIQKPQGRTADAKMYKISVQKEAIFKITGTWLASMGIDISEIDPTTLKIYNNGGRELPQQLNAEHPEGLIENAIEVVDGGDGTFDSSDYILFYGQGVNGFEYDQVLNTFAHYLHPYSKENIYWLTWGDGVEGKRISEQASVTNPAANKNVTSNYLFYRENEVTNLYHSGTIWFGEHFSLAENQRKISAYLVNAQNEPEAIFRYRVYGGTSGIYHHFELKVNNVVVHDTSFYGQRTQILTARKAGVLQNGQNAIEINYKTQSNDADAYLDYIEIEYVRDLTAIDNELIFYSPRSSESELFQVSGFTSDAVTVYDITDFSDIKKITGASVSNGTLSFTDSADPTTLKKYYAFQNTKPTTPNSITEDESSDIKISFAGAEYLIITHEDFYNQAVMLAEHRQAFDGYTTKVVKIQDVYDEFSCGILDPAAIRNFLKYAYENWEIIPEIVLLFGDGNFDYKNNYNTSYQNWIPPFEKNDYSETISRAMDDWYTYISGEDDIMDLAIGRIPAQNESDAMAITNKTINYDSNPVQGNWKNTVTILADDEYDQGGEIVNWNYIHTVDAEEIVADYIPATYDIHKIYLIEYPAIQSASISGIRKPAAADAFAYQLNKGTLLINYIGHGNETVLTHERILVLSEIDDRIQNGARQPFWVAATCAWGRYDKPEAQAMSELILLMDGRGAIGLLTSARDAYASPNARLNKLFMREIFPYTTNGFELGETTPVGVGLMNAKNYSSDTVNNQKYHILGDPALKLAIPKYQAYIRSVSPDTLKALSLVNVKGYIGKDDEPWSDFSGKIFMASYDSRRSKTYEFDGGRINYVMDGGTIFRGTANVENGEFDMSFFVPKDITYGGSLGRVSTYFWNDESDGAGKRDSLIVGGTSTSVTDQEGPEIEMHFDGQNTGEGAIVGPNPVLEVTIADSTSGINITSEIGHKIQLTFDNDLENRQDITDFFVFDEGSYLSGTIEYPLSALSGSTSEGYTGETGLTPGEHSIMIKAWDNYNNSSQKSINFTVLEEGEFKIDKLLNYPNPFADETTFTFYINQSSEIKLQIFTIAGRLIRSWNDFADAGYNYHLRWDGRDEEGDEIANGVYLYRISAKSLDAGDPKSDEKVGRLIYMR